MGICGSDSATKPPISGKDSRGCATSLRISECGLRNHNPLANPQSAMVIDLVLVGFGHVARRFVELLHEQRRRLLRDHDCSTRVVGVTTKRHGYVLSTRGLDA